MTYDPNNDLNNDLNRRAVLRDDANPWGWIVGIAAILILGVIVWAAMGSNPNTASNDPPAMSRTAPSTTGSAPSEPMTPPAAAPQRETKGSAQ